jgi:hypothetical protein
VVDVRKRMIWAIALAATILVSLGAAAIAAGEKPTVVEAGNLRLSIAGGVTPATLPRNELAPISLHVDGDLADADGSQPPALKEVVLDSDKNAIVNAKGLPACRASQLEAQDTQAAQRACPKAIIGRGTTEVEVSFPEQAPFGATGPLIVFNGGVKGGVTTVFIHTYVSVPAPTAIVVALKIRKEHKGPFGLHTVATVPVIAGGAGSVTHFELTIHRLFTYRGKRESFLEAKCASGHFLADTTFKFRDGSQISGEVIRACKAAS